MPAAFIAYRCSRVQREIFGNDIRTACWLVRQAAKRKLRHVWQGLWEGWQRYVRQRTDDEIQELVDQRIEKDIGVDIREWPDVVSREDEE
jgi:hypothetical protein